LEIGVAVEFNHTIVWARDSGASAKFLAEILGLPAPKKWGPFEVVATDNGTNVDFMDTDSEIKPQHYAFLVSETEFEDVLGRIRQRGLTYWADPAQAQLVKSIVTTAAGEFISKTRTATCWKSSPDPMAASARPASPAQARPSPTIISRWAKAYQHFVSGGGDFPVAGAGLDDPPVDPILDYEPVGSLAGTMRVRPEP
jgi:hypothetical protein